MGRPRGRPRTDYDEVVAEAICEALIAGHGLARICKLPGFPSLNIVYRWIDEEPDFREMYGRARALQQDAAVDEIIQIADTDPDPQRARNRIDARKWRAAKLAPKKYGDQQNINLSGSITIPEDQLDARINELLRKGGVVPALIGTGAAESED